MYELAVIVMCGLMGCWSLEDQFGPWETLERCEQRREEIIHDSLPLLGSPFATVSGGACRKTEVIGS